MNFINTLHHLDQNITLWINSFHCPLSDSIWLTFSDKKVWILMYVLIASFLFVKLGWKKALLVLAAVGLTVVCCDHLSELVKYSVCRLRPSWDNYMIEHGLHRLEHPGNYYGFFSAHAANAVGVATAAIIGLRCNPPHRYRTVEWILGIWAVCVSLSRIFAGKHFFGDVLVGAIIGLVLGFVFGKIALWIINKYL